MCRFLLLLTLNFALVVGTVGAEEEPGGGAEGGQEAGGGAGAAEATDPSAVLTQFQFQNVFTSETYNATGYSNTVVLQPVLPFPVAAPLVKDFFPSHIIRPTLPIIVPSADPDGAPTSKSGLGDLTVVDAYNHPLEGFGTLILGYDVVFPTSTDRQLGLGEWQAGPAVALLYKENPKWLVGGFVQQSFSLESDAQTMSIQPILIRHLPCEWYVGWGEIFWTYDPTNGNYNIPLEVRVGKVLKIGEQPVNIFVEPFYTPEGFHQGPASEWGIKLNITPLFPEKKFGPLLGCLFGE